MEGSHKRLLEMREKFAKAYGEETAAIAMDLETGAHSLAEVIEFATAWKA